MENLELQKTANEVRKGIVTALHAAKAGHPGGSLSIRRIQRKQTATVSSFPKVTLHRDCTLYLHREAISRKKIW